MPKAKTIKIVYSTNDSVALDDLKPLPEDNLDELCREIVAMGLVFPIRVWFDTKGRPWIVDGRKRVEALWKLAQQGYEIPAIPVLMVDANNKKDACRRRAQLRSLRC